MIRTILVMVILAQIYLLLLPHMGREPYRDLERMQTIVAWEQSHTPEAKAAMDTEEALLARHVKLRTTLYIVAFVLVNGVLCYAFWNHGNRKTTA